jgi:N-acetyl-anhydromuramyl-L-alanine amidase AmpD
MNIVNPNLTFRRLTYNNKPTYIILHHRAGDGNVESLHAQHLDEGWAGIGYNYYVRKDGVIYIGRPENAQGANCTGYNAKSISICAEGNFELEEMNELQKNAIIEIGKDIYRRYGILFVKGHKELIATACPGKNYPLEQIRQAITVKSNVVYCGYLLSTNLVKRKDGNVLLVQQRLISLGYLASKSFFKSNADGYFGNRTYNAIVAFQRNKGLQVDGIVGINTWNALFN